MDLFKGYRTYVSAGIIALVALAQFTGVYGDVISLEQLLTQLAVAGGLFGLRASKEG